MPNIIVDTPVICYTFDINGTNSGSLGPSYDLTIPNDFSIDTGALNTKSIPTASSVNTRTGFNSWTTPQNGFSISVCGKCDSWISTNQSLFSAIIDDKNFVVAFTTSTNILLYFNRTYHIPTIPDTFDNKYHSFVFTFSDKILYTYIDNVLIDTSIFDNSFSQKVIEQLYIGASTGGEPVYNGYIDEFKIYDSVLNVFDINYLYITLPIPTCFPKGTSVLTNLGPVAIEKLNPDQHTIRGKEIVAITQSKPLQQYIVCFEKDSLSKKVPSQQTLCSMEHKVFFKGEMVKARNLVDLCENVTFIPYNGDTLFNVLLKKHDKMMINNLICETLHPENIAAKISTMKDGQNKNKVIQELTKIIKENNVPEYKKLYASL